VCGIAGFFGAFSDETLREPGSSSRIAVRMLAASI
jgi:hypothetical protein